MARKTHRFEIVLKSELTKAETFEEFQKALDVAVLNDAGVYILAWNWDTSRANKQEDEGEKSESGKKLLSTIKKKIPDLVAFLKKYKWWQFYIGIAFVILGLQFIWNLLH